MTFHELGITCDISYIIFDLTTIGPPLVLVGGMLSWMLLW